MKTEQKRQIPIYNLEEQQAIRKACQFNAQLMDYLRPFIEPGISTERIDQLTYEYTFDHGHKPACLGYKGFPKSLCTSINEVVCHGIPDQTVLQSGDIVNIDLTTIVDGWYGDQSETFLVGKVSEQAIGVTQMSFDCLWKAIDQLEPFSTVYDVALAITEYAEANGYSVVRNYQGHGIGHAFHQPPGVPHYPYPELKNTVLKPGVCFTIEPMINLGRHETVADVYDGWTVRTADGSLSAQFEHQILMTEQGPEVLTQTTNGPQRGHRFGAS